MPEFFQTRMGQQYYTKDFPELKEMKKFNEAIGKNKIEDIVNKIETYEPTLALLLREYL